MCSTQSIPIERFSELGFRRYRVLHDRVGGSQLRAPDRGHLRESNA